MKKKKVTPNSNTDLCVDVKTKLVKDHVAKVGKNYAGMLRRDNEDHYTFTESQRPSKGKRAPQVFSGRYITVTCSADGLLRLNLKAVFVTNGFPVEEFSQGVSDEIVSAIGSLVEK